MDSYDWPEQKFNLWDWSDVLVRQFVIPVLDCNLKRLIFILSKRRQGASVPAVHSVHPVQAERPLHGPAGLHEQGQLHHPGPPQEWLLSLPSRGTPIQVPTPSPCTPTRVASVPTLRRTPLHYAGGSLNTFSLHCLFYWCLTLFYI